MRFTERVSAASKRLAALAASGVLLGGSCNSSDVQSVIDGLEAAAHSLDQFSQQQQTNDITFGDWLLNELND